MKESTSDLLSNLLFVLCLLGLVWFGRACGRDDQCIDLAKAGKALPGFCQ